MFIFQKNEDVLNNWNWMNHIPFFHQKTNYFYPIASVFVETDFSQRDFSNEFVPLLLNYIAKFGASHIPQPVKEINTLFKNVTLQL